MDLFLGLPIHVLLVHFVVAVGPLAAVAAILYAAMPRWRPQLRWPTAVLALITGVTGFLSEPSGEALEHRLGKVAPPATKELIHAHAEAGDVARIFAVLFALATLAMIFYLLRAQRAGEEPIAPRFGKVAGLVTTIVVVILALGTIGTVTNAGHLGSKAAWEGKVQQAR